MKMSSIDLSNELDEYTVTFYENIEAVATELGLQFMIVGATARDLILESTYNIRPHRATVDIDLGVSLTNWEQFELLKGALVATGKFNKTGSPHTLEYENTHPIDIVPFGDISNEETISWPPDHCILMNVAGFREAYDSSISIKLRQEPLLEIKIASLASLVVLKLLAWKDRGTSDDRDAKDIATIIYNYGTPVNEDRLWKDEYGLMEEEDNIIEHAGARLLGRDISKDIGSELLQTLISMLRDETSTGGQHRLATQMTRPMIDGDFENQLSLLKKMKAGLDD